MSPAIAGNVENAPDAARAALPVAAATRSRLREMGTEELSSS
jgi:hypothetical protein